MKRLLAIGECMIELAPKTGDMFTLGFAGDTFNTAWYARRLADDSIKVGYLSAVGDDAPSERMTEFMRAAGIEPYLSIRPKKSVGLYMISLENGERSFSYWRSASAARTLADDLTKLPKLSAGDIAFFSGITMAILSDSGRQRLLSVLAKARASGIQVVFDPNLRPRLWPDTRNMCQWIMKAAEVTNIALPSFEDEQVFFGDADLYATAARYKSVGVSTCVVKNGPGQVLISSPDGEELVTPDPVESVEDTTAAGDSFNAAFLVTHMSGQPLVAAVENGCALAGKVISARGALVEV